MATTPYVHVYVKLSGCEIQFNPIFRQAVGLYAGCAKYRLEKSNLPEAGADVSFITQVGYRPKVTVYKEPLIDSESINDYGTLISNDAGSSFNLPNDGAEASSTWLIIAEAVSNSGINFTYDKTPKFREQETPHVYFDTVKGTKEVQTSPSPFSKNVTVKAHTEYTAHINGRIGESTGGLNALFLTLTTSDTITGATWNEAKDAYAAGKPVILCGPQPGTYILCDGASENYLSFSDVQWLSDGRVGRK